MNSTKIPHLVNRTARNPSHGNRVVNAGIATAITSDDNYWRGVLKSPYTTASKCARRNLPGGVSAYRLSSESKLDHCDASDNQKLGVLMAPAITNMKVTPIPMVADTNPKPTRTRPVRVPLD